jgi:hypothetical protein
MKKNLGKTKAGSQKREEKDSFSTKCPNPLQTKFFYDIIFAGFVYPF